MILELGEGMPTGATIGLTAAILLASCSTKMLSDPSGPGDADAARDAQADAGMPSAQPPAPDASGCAQTSASSLPGVLLSFPDQPCVFTAAELSAGVEIRYRLAVADSAIAPLVHPLDGVGAGCNTPGPSGLIVGYQVSGGGQTYCLCDVGLCAPSSLTTTLVPGTYDFSFTWQGENWLGPSDTGRPKGAAFPPGNYQVSVSSSGSFTDGPNSDAATNFMITAVLPITVTR